MKNLLSSGQGCITNDSSNDIKLVVGRYYIDETGDVMLYTNKDQFIDVKNGKMYDVRSVTLERSCSTVNINVT
tara:strand:- start:836 stop:1054 length:219 start_codon:yes stop_codon:yes gene_type:complete